MIAMLSDIHYGLAFDNNVGKYDSELAWKRVMKYAYELIDIAERNSIYVIYVPLMGDMISGIIHQTIRIENRENLIEQIVGCSELVAAFLKELGEHFEVHVVSVAGNHSRLDANFENALRGEKLDMLITWYCKSKLANYENVYFHDNDVDATIASFVVNNHTFVAVHGDYDADLSKTAQRVEKLISRNISYILAGHLHVPDMRFENTGYIRNGCVCGSGDDYTIKKRLFSPPYQVAMIVGDKGVESIYPISLLEAE